MKKRAYKGYKRKVYEYLQLDPRFRERINKNKGIANLLYKQFPSFLEPFNSKEGRERLIEVVIAYSSMNRWWARLLQDHEDLRGKDYNDKYILREEKKKELGYR